MGSFSILSWMTRLSRESVNTHTQKKTTSDNLNKSDVFAEDYAVIFSNYS